MRDESRREISKLSPFKMDGLQWKRLQGDDGFDYPIDYWIAVLGVQREAGRVVFLSKWEPNKYCHFHRHTARSTVLVLEGAHHVVEQSVTEMVHKTRKPGHLVRNPPGDVHMEFGGPEGSLLFFSMQTTDGQLFDILDKDENVLRALTLEDFASGNL